MSSKEKIQHISAAASKDQVADEVIATTGILGSERNRLYTFCMVLLMALVIITFKLISVSENNANNHKVAWVKMYGNGTWDVELHDNLEPTQVLQRTVDSILAQWVERRFSEKPETIRNDFGYASLFLSPEKRTEFVSADQFNAPQVAAEIMKCRGCRTLDYKVGPIDHFDRGPAYYTDKASEIYRTNIFVDRIQKNAAGELEGVEKRIVRVQWRLMEPEEIQDYSRKEDGVEWLRNNPIGIEIVDYQELNDPSNI